MNIVLIVCDTVRSDYCGCYGNDWVRTPAIDALARESVLMRDFYSASFPTGPMRKDVFSGRFTFTYTDWRGEREPSHPLLQEVLRAHGYRTAFIGDTANSPQYRVGFDHEQIIRRDGANLAQVPEDAALPAAPRKLRIPMERIRRIVRNAAAYDGEEDHAVARTMRAAHKWVEQEVGGAQPFFLWVDTFDPHEPWDPPRYYIDMYDPDYAGDELMEPAYEPAGYASAEEIRHMRCMYAAKLTMVDRWVGFLLDGIKRMGLWDDTAVVFTSDHGFCHGEHNLIGKVLLDREGAICGRWPLYDTIAHPPLLLKAPGLPGGATCAAFCQPPDLAPTVLELAGATVPDTVQGFGLLPLARGERDEIRDVAVSSLTYVQDADVRSPTSLRTRDHLYIYGGDEWDCELYDLAADPGEMHNVIDDGVSIAKELHGRLLDFLRSVDCPGASLAARREFRPARREHVPYRKLL